MTDRVPQRIVLESWPASLAVAIEPLLGAMGWGVLCPRCQAAHEPNPWVQGDNLPGDGEWRLTCACTVRVIRPTEVRTVPVGSALLEEVETAWITARMAVRCLRRAPECQGTAPAITSHPDGRRTARCGCASHQFSPVPAGTARSASSPAAGATGSGAGGSRVS